MTKYRIRHELKILEKESFSANPLIPIKKKIEINDEDFVYLDKLGFLNKQAFGYEGHDIYISLNHHPLSPKGEDFLNKNWYSILKESTVFQFLRDLFALIGGAAAIVLTILQITNRG